MDVFRFSDPILNNTLSFTLIPRGKLSIAPYQRQASKTHIKDLMVSISRLGFLVPLVVYPEEEKFIIIDGQHRFLAGVEVGMNEFPCVVVPKELGTKMINLNIEKQPNIREKAYVAYRIYQYLLENQPEIKETDGQVEDSVEYPHYITLGFAYQINEKFHGSAYESILSKCEEFLDVPLKEAEKERNERGKGLEEIDQEITQLIEIMKEKNLPIHPFIRKDILSQINPIKGKGKRGEFWEVIQRIKEALVDLKEHPERIIESQGSS